MISEGEKSVDITVSEMLKKEIGMTDEDKTKLSPGVQRMLEKRPMYSKYRMVAEVIESTYCFAKLKQGDRYVFNV